jgi:hypothetical protein
MTEVEREAWMVFRSVVAKFLGNNKDPDYVTIVANMLENFKALGCLMGLKIHFSNSHLELFRKILMQRVRNNDIVFTRILRKWK